MIESLQLVVLPFLLLAIVLRRTEKKVVVGLQREGALSPETARELPRLPALGRWQVARLEKIGAIVDAGGGRCYFAPAGYRAFRRARRLRALVAVPTIVVALLVLRYFIG